MSRKKIIIIGGGLSGLSTAWHLQKKGIECRIFEKEREAGGLCRSKQVNDFTFDYDGHLLHFRHEYALRLVKSLLGNNLAEHKRSAWIYCRGRYSRYPFQANLYGLPSSIVKECLFEFIKARRNSCPSDKNTLNFSEWILRTFGRGIARHFMVPYNKKFWTVPLRSLTCEWLDGFIPVPSLHQLIEGTVEESRRLYGYNARFWYPREGGIQALPRAFANSLKYLYTRHEVKNIDMRKKLVILRTGEREPFDYLVSTVPLPEMPRLTGGFPSDIRRLFKKLRWNSIFNFNAGIDRPDASGRHWAYFPEKRISFFRVGFPHNFSAVHPSGMKSSLYAEVAYSREKPLDKRRVVTLIKNDLKRTGILDRYDRICAQDINDIPYGYPIYDAHYARVRGRILSYLENNAVLCRGRYGAWRYMSMEDVVLEGKQTAELISANG
ncbi:MAG: FAD-dependent oxidoreductase [Candidatus Omnitrophica bacterium]|nr:FAD-dependent oxidoreductase [Candidatus Omnitrophota bacterium]